MMPPHGTAIGPPQVRRARTIRARILGFSSLLLGAISTFIFLFFPRVVEREALRGIESKAASIGAMAAHSVASAVLFESREDMEEAIRGALENDEVTLVEVLRPTGEVLASVRAEGPRAGESAGSLGARGDVFTYQAPVLTGGAPLGVVRLELSLAGLRTQVAGARRIIALISAAVFLLGILAAFAISSHVTTPLREVASAAERIAAGDLDSRAHASTEDEVGQVARSFNHMVDRLQEAHGALARSKDQLEQVLDNIPAHVAMYDPEGRYLYVNPAAIPDPTKRQWILSHTAPEAASETGMGEAEAREAHEAILRCARERRLITTEGTAPSLEGAARHVVHFYSPILAGGGEVVRVIGYGLDVSELRNTEAELREAQERLLQAQKMESVGRLAGGIAHDFNNLLTSIAGNTELILLEMDGNEHAVASLHEINRAAERAAGLTKQLLAFSRKQVTQPKVFRMNEAVAGVHSMLRRLIGEDIRLSIHLAEEPWTVKADLGQIEQVLVNLVVNARDAMPMGGDLTVETSNKVFEEGQATLADEPIPPGEYVMLSVSDTGIGMGPETLQRVFEPFFTLKGPGKGTGLGLATVYGVVKQASGYVMAYSEEGLGSTFKVILPRAQEPADDLPTGAVSIQLPQGSETILVAEDQDGVRGMIVKILERCGYVPISASGPEEALALAEVHGEAIDLILTDVVMPDMSGPALVERLRPRLPTVPVVYMSGYTDDQLQRHGVLNAGVTLVEKPFTAARLTAVVRAALDGHRGTTPKPQTEASPSQGESG